MVIIPDKPEIHPLQAGWYMPHAAQVDMLRLDLLHPEISGNKWYKLKYNIAHAISAGYSSLLTFGGGYSNHLAATAVAAKLSGVHAIGIVRGIYQAITPTLQFCADNGMELHYLPQAEYDKKNDAVWLDELAEKFGQPFIIPEGGANEYGRRGAEDIAKHIPASYTHICISVGSGTTMAGICNGLNGTDTVIYGYAPMKGGAYLTQEICDQITAGNTCKWQLFDTWHFGGFGKSNATLIAFMNAFYTTNNIPLDVVYTAKMMYGVREQLEAGFFPVGARILCIHSGGLQGNASVADKLLY